MSDSTLKLQGSWVVDRNLWGEVKTGNQSNFGALKISDSDPIDHDPVDHARLFTRAALIGVMVKK